MKRNNKLTTVFLLFTFFLFPDNSFSQDRISYQGQYIGGILNGKPVFISKLPQRSTRVNNTKELLFALKNARKNTTIFLDKNGDFDLTGYESIVLSKGITLFGSRGIDGNGPLVYTSSLKSNPLFITKGDNIQIEGIRFKGPDGFEINQVEISKQRAKLKREKPNLNTNTTLFNTNGIPNSTFIKVNNQNVSIINCEIFNWSYCGVIVENKSMVTVKYSYIHHIRRVGLGYGIMVDGGLANVIGNLFDYNRHSIAGTGKIGSSFIASGNICGENHSSHIFDMHGGKDRKDGTNIAGSLIIINDNTFYVNKSPALVIRGVPTENCKVFDNIVVDVSGSSRLKKESEYFIQRDSRGKQERFHLYQNVIRQK